MTTNNSTERIVTDKFEAYMLEPDIIYFRFNDNQLIDVEDIHATLEINFKLSDVGSVKRIIHAGKYTTISAPARKLLEKIGLPAIAEAYIIESLAQKLIFRAYLKLRKNDHPTKSFQNLTDAVDWLRTF